VVKKVITGNYASSYGAKLARAQVVAAYPITPQTSVVEKIAEFVASGEMDAQYVKVESEHSAMAACITASQTGARTFTATSAHGLTLMHEMLIWASGARTPVVMTNVNRAMAPPWSVWADHLDSVAQRDTGWLQYYCESNQEVLDSIILAYKVSESRDVLLPAFLTLDAFYLSHTYETVDIPDQKEVDEFLPSFDPPYKFDVEDPHLFGSLSFPHQFYMEWRYQIAQSMEKAREKILEVEKEFEKTFGRSHGGLLDLYRCEGADVVLIAAGTMASTIREVVDWYRDKGEKVGLARLRVFRPFPVKEVRELAKKVKVIGVLDRSYSFGYGGAFFAETGGALYNVPDKPLIKNYVVGIGGRDVTPDTVSGILDNALSLKDKGELDKEIEWIELKEGGE
jgi:2-oxoisovalerate ferredoxin oxidoreductase alpha subunit